MKPAKDPGEKPVQGPRPQKKSVVYADFADSTAIRSIIESAFFTPMSIEEIKSGFGSFAYEEDGTKRPIKWRVLERTSNKALIITERGIVVKPFNDVKKDVTWQTSTLRNWLNNEFLNTAFTNREKKLILETTVTADKNPNYSTDPGKDTQDKVFLLSVQEAEKYFSSNIARQVKATPYARKQGAYSGVYGYFWLWLRSPGRTSSGAAGVRSDGAIGFIDRVDSDDVVVRPALWVKMNN